jgi:hypothetical protein
MIRSGARAARLAALTAHLVQRPPPEVPDLAQLPVQLLAPALESRQLISTLWDRLLFWVPNYTQNRFTPATTKNPCESDAHPPAGWPPLLSQLLNILAEWTRAPRQRRSSAG